MPTTDNQQSNATAQTQATTNFQAPSDFDFGNLQPTENAETAQPSSDFSLELSPSVEAGNPQPETANQGFDFSLDLPSAYAAQEPEVAQSPVAEVAVPQFHPHDQEIPLQEEKNLTFDQGKSSPEMEIQAPSAMESLLHEESQPSPAFSMPEEMNPVAETVETPAPIEETPVMKTPFADEEPVANEMDPFEAMKASLETAPVEESVEASNSQSEMQITPQLSMNETPEMPAPIQASEFKEVVDEPILQTEEKADEVSEMPQAVSLDAMLQAPVAVAPVETPAEQSVSFQAPQLEMPSAPQFEVPQVPVDIPQAPVQTSEPQAPVSASDISVPAPEAQGQALFEANAAPMPMLSLDEMIAQPQVAEAMQAAPQSEMQAPVAENPAPQAVNPLTAPIGYPPIQQTPVQQPTSKAGIFAGVFFVLVLVAAGAMLLIKYPDLFQSNPFASKPQELAQTTELPSTSEETTEDHGSAPTEEETSVVMPNEDESQTPSDFSVVEVEETETLSDEIQDIVLGEEVETLEPETSETPEIPAEKADSETVEPKKDANTGSEDALDAVEDLLGPINTNDALLQEIANYKAQVNKLKETAKAQKDLLKAKMRGRVVEQLERLEQDLEKGGKMTISEWKAQKAELDQILENANNA